MAADLTTQKIYCAGPLFNAAEKREMESISEALHKLSFETFLPHQDGLEFASLQDVLKEKTGSLEEVNTILSKAIFALDVYQIIHCHGLLLNMNGRVPDEGAMVEAGIAWASDKALVIYKNDARSMFNGSDNPLVVGLANFHIIDSYDAIPTEFQRIFAERASAARPERHHIPPLDTLVKCGKQISSLLPEKKDEKPDTIKLCDVLIELFGKTGKHNAKLG